MALSAQDVHDKQFKLVRNSTGYDMDEVDAFLDEVESEIASLTEALAAAQDQARLREQATAEQAPAEEAPPVPGPTPAQDAVAQPPEASLAAARILELAQRTADEYVADARRTAERAVVDAEKAARKSVKKLEAQRRELEDRVAALRTFESEVRARLTGYFESQLNDLRALSETSE